MWTNQHQEPIERRQGKDAKGPIQRKGGYARGKGNKERAWQGEIKASKESTDSAGLIRGK